MMDRDKFLVMHGADSGRWAKRHDIEPCSAPCYFCGAELRTTLPFACGELRGLVAPRCECGNANGPYRIVHPRMGMIDYLLQQAPARKEPPKRKKKRLLRLVAPPTDARRKS